MSVTGLLDGPVGFVGLGTIGLPMARRLLAWPGGLQAYDVAAEPLDALRRAGAVAARSVAGLAAECGVVAVMVRDDAQVSEVVDEALTTARPGTVLVVHSTVAPDLPVVLDGRAARAGVRLVDAPVSGGAPGAEAGTLAVLVGGPADTFEAVREVLGLLGPEVVHCGPVGAGTRFKLARNLLHFVSFAAAGEAARLAEAAGLDLVDLGRVVRHTDAVTGGPGAILHRPTAAPVAPGDGWFAVLDHVRTLGEKDLDHALRLADDLGVDVALARLARRDLAHALGLADLDGLDGLDGLDEGVS